MWTVVEEVLDVDATVVVVMSDWVDEAPDGWVVEEAGAVDVESDEDSEWVIVEDVAGEDVASEDVASDDAVVDEADPSVRPSAVDGPTRSGVADSMRWSTGRPDTKPDSAVNEPATASTPRMVDTIHTSGSETGVTPVSTPCMSHSSAARRGDL